MKQVGTLFLLCAYASATPLPFFKHDGIVQTEQGICVDLPQTANKTINLQYTPQQVINIRDQAKLDCESCTKTNQPYYLKYVTSGAHADTALELVIQKEKLDKETRLLLAQHNDAYAHKTAIRVYRKVEGTATSATQWTPILTLPDRGNSPTPDIYIRPDGTLHL